MRRAAAAAISAAILMAVLATAAHAYVYYKNGTAIGRVSLSGTDHRSRFVETGAGLPCAITVDASHIYWTALNDHWIGRADIDGSHVVRDWIKLSRDACGVTVNSDHIYWRDTDGTIGRADLNGSNVNQDFLKTGVYHPLGAIVVHDNFIFFTGVRGIGRVNLDGKDLKKTLVPAEAPTALAAHGDFVYWNNIGMEFHGTTIGRAKLNGTSVDQKFIDLTSVDRHPCSLAIRDHRVFYTDWRRGNGGPDSTLRFADVFGDDHQLLSLSRGYNCPSALATDSLGPQ